MSAVDPVSLALSGVGMIMAQKKAKAAAAAAGRQAELRARQLKEKQAIETKQRREALKKQMATQRARMGASGASGSGGSGEALLKGLHSETERNIDDMYKLNKSQLDGIYQDYASARRQNLLEATQAGVSGLMSMYRHLGVPKINFLKEDKKSPG